MNGRLHTLVFTEPCYNWCNAILLTHRRIIGQTYVRMFVNISKAVSHVRKSRLEIKSFDHRDLLLVLLNRCSASPWILSDNFRRPRPWNILSYLLTHSHAMWNFPFPKRFRRHQRYGAIYVGSVHPSRSLLIRGHNSWTRLWHTHDHNIRHISIPFS